MLIVSASALGQAQAFSFVDVGAPDATPSIVMMGEPVAPALEAYQTTTPQEPLEDERFPLSASIVAIGAEAIPMADEAVASVSQDTPAERELQPPSWAADTVPTLMRGGIVAEALRPEATDE